MKKTFLLGWVLLLAAFVPQAPCVPMGTTYAASLDKNSKKPLRASSEIVPSKESRIEELAGGKILADRVVDYNGYDVEYVLPTKEGQDVVLFVSYKSGDPQSLPDSILFYFPNNARPFTGERLFHIPSQEGEEIGLRFILRQNITLDTISIEPPLTQEHSQKNLTVESKGGFIVQFIVVSRDGLLRSLFIEPDPHPFVNVYQPPEHLLQSTE